MKAYSNKSDRVNSQKCLFSEINKGKRAAKKATRFAAKLEIENEKVKSHQD